jgi:deazaflavin-dependent oxidoreductase (nitroreductase family)
VIRDEFWQRIKSVQRVHRVLYDSGLGWLVGWLILLLRHTGRRSGRRYATPMQYERIGSDYYVGSARGCQADWFRNVRANPQVEIAVGRKVFRALAETVTDPGQVADFLALRLKRHPLMIGLMMKLAHGLPMRPGREQLLELGRSTALVIFHTREAA